MALADTSSCAKPSEDPAFPQIIELNVGGQVYITRHSTLVSIPGSLLWEMFSQKDAHSLARDSKSRFFVDRDGFLFRYILDYMRDQELVLPEHFPERGRLQREAEYFKLTELVKTLAPKLSKQNSIGDEPCPSDPEELSPGGDTARNLAAASALLAGAAGGAITAAGGGGAGQDLRRSGFITIGYRGSYTLGRDSQTDAKFRRVARIMVCGKTSLAKEVFGETLNESRDPDRPPERYTSRYYLKFTFLEQAFDRLADAGFHMVACNSTGTCAFAHEQTDDKIWTSYTEYVFYRASAQVQTSQQQQQQNLASGNDSSFPGSLWLSVATPTPAELEQNIRKHLASTSEPILDLRTEAAAVLPVDRAPLSTTEITPLTAMECAPVATVERAPIATAESAPTATQELSQSPEVAHLNTSPGSLTGGYSEPDMALPPPPDKGPPSEDGSSGSLPWPEAPEECGPQRPNTLDLSKPLKKLEEVKQTGQRRNSDQTSIQENGLESGGGLEAPPPPRISQERQALQSELGKCIQDFRNIKIPVSFPNKKRRWQNDLLRKYQL